MIPQKIHSFTLNPPGVYRVPPVESLQVERQNAPRVGAGMTVPNSPCGVTYRLTRLKSFVVNTPKGTQSYRRKTVVRGLRIPVLWTVGADLASANMNRNAQQGITVTRSPNALSRCRLIGRPVIRTNEVTLVLRKKMVVHPVHG